jgi:hypothetical protein
MIAAAAFVDATYIYAYYLPVLFYSISPDPKEAKQQIIDFIHNTPPPV